MQEIVLLLSENVAKMYRLWPRKGRIGLDADGDLTIVELGKEHVIRTQELHSKQKVTPFDGWAVKGSVRYTVVRGNVVYDGHVGYPAGEWIRPSMASG
jgi:dihydroorotase